MPNYAGSLNSTTPSPVKATPINPGGASVLLFNAESPSAPQASMAVYFGDTTNDAASAISMEILFAGDPGSFGLLLQTADTDADAFYQNVGMAITALSSNKTARSEYPQIKAKYARAYISSRTNAIAVTVKLSR